MRVVLEFDGDKSKLSFSDRSTIAAGKLLSGRELPYATLMYIWSNKEPVGTVVPNPAHARACRWSSRRAAPRASARGRR